MKKFRKDFEYKLTLFASSVKIIAGKEETKRKLPKKRKVALQDKVSKYGLNPDL